jgi:hypothetical protein
VAHRSQAQLSLTRRIEGAIRLAAPLLDLVLFAGERLSRVAGRNEVDPDPPRRLGARETRTWIGGPPTRPPTRPPAHPPERPVQGRD